jgi:hypothetical protein
MAGRNQRRAAFLHRWHESRTQAQRFVAPPHGLGRITCFGISLGKFQIEFRLRGLQSLDCFTQSRNAAIYIRSVPNLRHGDVQFAGILLGIVRCHLAAIPSVRPFGARRHQIPRGLAPLDEVIRHHHVNRIFGPAARHVAGRAIAVAAHSRGMRGRMAFAAGSVVVRGCLLPAWNIVRIMASGAGHRALLEAFRFL